jgi:glycerol-3-phosphate dehydrogenase
MKPAWTEGETLPGGDLPPGGIVAWVTEMQRKYPGLPADLVRGVARRHGSLAPKVLGSARTLSDLGEDFGNGLTAVEIDYLIREEWALTVDDILLRRTKCGLGMAAADQDRVAAYVARALANA